MTDPERVHPQPGSSTGKVNCALGRVYCPHLVGWRTLLPFSPSTNSCSYISNEKKTLKTAGLQHYRSLHQPTINPHKPGAEQTNRKSMKDSCEKEA